MVRRLATRSYAANRQRSQRCGLFYSRVVEIESAPELRTRPKRPRESSPSSRKRRKIEAQESVDGNDDFAEDEIHHFRRVQVVHKIRPSRDRRGVSINCYL